MVFATLCWIIHEHKNKTKCKAHDTKKFLLFLMNGESIFVETEYIYLIFIVSHYHEWNELIWRGHVNMTRETYKKTFNYKVLRRNMCTFEKKEYITWPPYTIYVRQKFHGKQSFKEHEIHKGLFWHACIGKTQSELLI